MSEDKMKHITIIQYNDNMGRICFPEGFEDHLKSLVPKHESDYYYNEKNEAGEEISHHIVENRVSSIVHQTRCFGWSDYKRPVEWNDPRLVGEKPDKDLMKIIKPIISDGQELRLIVKGDIVVGVVLQNSVEYYISDNNQYFWLSEDKYILPYRGYIFDSSSDNNGAGYKERDWSRYLICLPNKHNLW